MDPDKNNLRHLDAGQRWEVDEVRVEEVMESGFGSRNEDKNGGFPTRSTPDVQAIVKVAHEELRRLIQQRTEIMERIGSIKQTITGLCKLFGDDVLSDALCELVNGKAGVRRPSITQACRTVLMEAGCPVTAQEVCERIQQRAMPDLPRSKNLVASVTTLLSRLVQYGEARTVPRDTGPRAWLWVSESGDVTAHPVNSAEHLVSEHGLDGL